MPPTTGYGCREAASLGVEAEQLVDLRATHRVEVFRHGELAFHKSEATLAVSSRRIQGDELHKRLAGFCDDHRLTADSGLDQAGQVGFGFMNVDRWHGRLRLTKSF